MSTYAMVARAAASAKPLFSFENPQGKQSLYQQIKNEMTCKFLYGCSMKELPTDLRKIVKKVFDGRHRLSSERRQNLAKSGSRAVEVHQTSSNLPHLRRDLNA